MKLTLAVLVVCVGLGVGFQFPPTPVELFEIEDTLNENKEVAETPLILDDTREQVEDSENASDKEAEEESKTDYYNEAEILDYDNINDYYNEAEQVYKTDYNNEAEEESETDNYVETVDEATDEAHPDGKAPVDIPLTAGCESPTNPGCGHKSLFALEAENLTRLVITAARSFVDVFAEALKIPTNAICSSEYRQKMFGPFSSILKMITSSLTKFISLLTGDLFSKQEPASESKIVTGYEIPGVYRPPPQYSDKTFEFLWEMLFGSSDSSESKSDSGSSEKDSDKEDKKTLFPFPTFGEEPEPISYA